MGLDDRKGGIESFLYNMSCNVDWTRFQFDFLCYGKNPAYGEKLATMGSNLIEMPSRKNILAYAGFLKRVLAQNYDVVHLHKNSPTDFLPVVAARKAPCRVIVHAHNTAANAAIPSFVTSMGRIAFGHHADVRLACSAPAGEYVFGAESDFRLFPNAIQLDDYTYNPGSRLKKREELGISQESFVVGVVGRLVAQKNYLFMVRAFSRFHEAFPDSVLVCVGEGNMRNDIEALIASLGLTDNVMLLGRRDDVPRLYSAFDCACCPSIYEGFSIFTLEAQAAGLPCLVSPAVPREARMTSLVRPTDLEEGAWARALENLASTGAPRKGLSVDGVAAMQPFDVASAAQKLMSIYDKLAASCTEVA